MTDSADYSGEHADYTFVPEPEPALGDNIAGVDGDLVITIPAAKYAAGKTATAQDSYLVAGNILDGVTIFGVEGTIVSPEPATGGDVVGYDGDLVIAIPAAKYAAGKTATAQDSYLVAGNIKNAVSIFGVTGTYAGEGTIALQSIQYGSITIPSGASSATATITAVDTTKSILILLGQSYSTSYPHYSAHRIELTNSTTVTCSRISNAAVAGPTAKFVCIEFASGIKSVQSGTITMPNEWAEKTATITAVDVAKSIVVYLGFTGDDTGARNWQQMKYLTLTNATTVTSTCDTNTGTNVVGFMVLEFS